MAHLHPIRTVLVRQQTAMLRLSKLADYAVVVLIRLAEGERCCPDASRFGMDPVQTSPGIALATGVPEPTVAKVLKALAGAGLVASQRGARGGYRLCKPLHAIAISDVITAIDGPIALTACVDGHQGTCEVAKRVRRAGQMGSGERDNPPGRAVGIDNTGRYARRAAVPAHVTLRRRTEPLPCSTCPGSIRPG